MLNTRECASLRERFNKFEDSGTSGIRTDEGKSRLKSKSRLDGKSKREDKSTLEGDGVSAVTETLLGGKKGVGTGIPCS